MNKIHSAAIATLILGAATFAGWKTYHSPLKFEHRQLIIISAPSLNAPTSTSHEFDVEIAQSEEQGKTGLSGRTNLEEDHGMLFPIPNQNVSMWMKDTKIPLDIIFIKDNAITKIVLGARPLSTDLIPSGTPVTAVLELKAGAVDEEHLAIGDRVVY